MKKQNYIKFLSVFNITVYLILFSCMLIADEQVRTRLKPPSFKEPLEPVEIAGKLIPPEVRRTIEWEFGDISNVKKIDIKKSKKSSYDQGSIGRKLTGYEWRESQAWQALAGYNMAKKARLHDIDAIVWCTLRGGGNSGTYMKPLIDYHDHAKLSFYTLRSVFQRVFGASDDIDLFYGPRDKISPVIMNLGEKKTVDLHILVKDMDGKIIDNKTYSKVKLSEGRTVEKLRKFKPDFPRPGYYGIEYIVKKDNQEISKSFEFRNFSTDDKFNGKTHFKDKKKKSNKVDTETRVKFLKNYAAYASRFFNDPGLNTKVVSEKEIQETIKKIKPQPLPEVRQRILLNDGWEWIGYRDGETGKDKERINEWKKIKGVKISQKELIITDTAVTIDKDISPLKWRFFIQWKVKLNDKNKRALFSLSQGGKTAVTVGFNEKARLVYFSGDKEIESDKYLPDKWYEFKVEVDLSSLGRWYNLYVNNKLIGYAVDIQNKDSIRSIDRFSIKGIKNERIDHIWGVGYEPDEDVRLHAYTVRTFIDEDFDISPEISGWQSTGYMDTMDTGWNQGGDLPLVIGSERNKGRDLFMRKTVRVGDFQKAYLNIEALDPGGEVYINGKKAAQLEREPVTLDVSSYLKKNENNLIAIKVNHVPEGYFCEDGHTSDDLLFGWFAGRISLDLTEKNRITDLFLYTSRINKSARMKGEIRIKNEDSRGFKGKINIQFFPWFPDESKKPSTEKVISVNLKKGEEKVLPLEIDVPRPKLWTYLSPNLYKVRAVLFNSSGEPVDDLVITTGIRTISQKGGTFRINGMPEMLNGATLMQFTAPLTELATWHRCPPKDWVVKQILMARKLGNTIRFHIPSCSYSDPRYAEYGDQLGIMSIYVPTGWNRKEWIEGGETWTGPKKSLNQQVEEYIIDIKQVRNHPSIIMWEVSNEGVSKMSKSDLFNAFYPLIHKTDPSRLFMPLKHYYRDGAMVVPGNQIAPLGYGKRWSNLDSWTPKPKLINDRDQGYYAVEFAEIAGQDNWDLVCGKPCVQISFIRMGSEGV